MPAKRPSELVFLPLGGAGEIGMNMYLYGLGRGSRRKWLMVDCGVKFGDERDPGIDVMVPDTTFIESERHNLLGIVLTHAHEDHLGAVAWLWPRLQAPVYCTPFAAELLKGKLEEAGLLNAVPLRVQPMGARFSLGEFDIELVPVTHSIPEPNSVVLRTPAGTIGIRATGRLTPLRPFRPIWMKSACVKSAMRELMCWFAIQPMC